MALDFPSNPVDGEVFGSYVWSASKGVWQSREESAAPAITSPVPPANPNNGDIWFDSSDGISYVYYDDGNSGSWVEMISSGVVSLNTKANLAGGNSFTGNQFVEGGVIINGGGSALQLKPLNSDHTYISFFPRTATPNTRGGYFGYPGVASTNIALSNELTNGNIDLFVNGTGQLNLPSRTYLPNSVVQVQHVQTSTWQSIATQDISAISGLSISFTPKFSNSKILLQSMINSTNTYVATYGFLKNGAVMSPLTNSNSAGSVATQYWFDTSTNYMNNVYISYMEDAGSTAARTYAAAACSSWGGTIYTMQVNDRSDGAMRSFSSMTIFEIAQ